MCLIVDEEKTQKMKKEKGGRTVWKVYRVEDGANGLKFVYSPIRTGNPPIESGHIISDRPSISCSIFSADFVGWGETKIYSGIHVTLTREAARKYKKELEKDFPYKKFVIFRCEGDMSKFVAAGSATYIRCHNNQAVFKQIFVSPEDWSKALNGDFR